MNPRDLLTECNKAIQRGWDGVRLVVPRRSNGKRMRVMPGVMGEIVCENSDGHTVVLVKDVAGLQAACVVAILGNKK